jgi:hypothetical protein
MWAGDYTVACQHFHQAIETYQQRTDIFYGMAGAAKWCMEAPDAATKYWLSGIDAPYAVGGSVVRLPLLLFAASILRPGIFPRQEAESIMRQKVKDPRAKNWPGPLAKFVLSLIDESSLSESGKENEALPHRMWLAIFYKRLLDLSREKLNLAEFRSMMREMVETSRVEWSKEAHFFYLMRCEEFFIARHEASLK